MKNVVLIFLLVSLGYVMFVILSQISTTSETRWPVARGFLPQYPLQKSGDMRNEKSTSWACWNETEVLRWGTSINHVGSWGGAKWPLYYIPCRGKGGRGVKNKKKYHVYYGWPFTNRIILFNTPEMAPRPHNVSACFVIFILIFYYFNDYYERGKHSQHETILVSDIQSFPLLLHLNSK